jgi:hypothetical protein
MLVKKTVGTLAGNRFVVSIDAIKPSDRSPNEYFRVLWSVADGEQIIESSFIIKFTDALFFTHNVRPYRDVMANMIVPAREIAEMLLGHLRIDETGTDINHSVEFFFAERPDGSGRFDGHICWNHKGTFYSA